jgi:type IV pilus assembly protein PilM
MAKLKIGFDIGNSSLKIAVAKKDETILHEVRLPDHMVENDVIAMPNAFSDFLKKTCRDLQLPKVSGALMLPYEQTICRLITMPKMTEEQLLMNLPYEFSDFIHGETDQYHCDYALCEPLESDLESDEELMTMMAAAVSKQQVYDYIRMFSRAGVSLKVLLPKEMALIQLVQAYRKRSSGAPKEYCFVDLGYLSTQVIVVCGDRIQAMRQVDVGISNLDTVIADELGIDVFLADTYKRKNHADILNHPRCKEVYDRISVEILKVINFYHFTFRENTLDGFYLIGGGANIAPLRDSLEEIVGLPALDVSELIPGKITHRELSNSTILAVGMSLAEEA